ASSSSSAQTLSITPASLTITADDKSMTYGGTVPTLTATYTGLLNGDKSSVVSGLSLSTTASSSSNAGQYTITASGGTADNYTVTDANGTLTINQPAAITTSNSATFTAGSNGSFTFTTTGFPVATISESGALPSGVTFTDNGDGTATLSGVPLTSGNFTFTVTAHNGIGSDATQSFTLTSNPSTTPPTDVSLSS